MARQPESRLAQATLPEPLYRALRHLFAQGIDGCMLVGGTALAGYYAGHRRSDDLDLFTRDAVAHRATSLAVGSLESIGAEVTARQSTAQFYAVDCNLDGHAFTAQVVLDANLFAVGESLKADDGVEVVDLTTLLKLKAATLVSRCGEKDLYDLLWLFRSHGELELATIVELGREIDAGMSAETALISLVGAPLRQAACDFSLTQDAAAVHQEISALRGTLAAALEQLARDEPLPPIGELIQRLG